MTFANSTVIYKFYNHHNNAFQFTLSFRNSIIIDKFHYNLRIPQLTNSTIIYKFCNASQWFTNISHSEILQSFTKIVTFTNCRQTHWVDKCELLQQRRSGAPRSVLSTFAHSGVTPLPSYSDQLLWLYSKLTVQVYILNMHYHSEKNITRHSF